MMRLIVGALLGKATAVLVAPGSPCEQKCGNVLSTTLDQLVCDDSQFVSSSIGQVYSSCVTCETTSTYTTTKGNSTTSDLQAMLYNMRYNAGQCIFNLEEGPCTTSRACGPFSSALEFGNLSSAVTPYGYCSLWPDDGFFERCTNCLITSGNYVLRNYLSVLDGACTELIQPPGTVPLDGNVFSTTLVNVTNPSATAAINSHNKVGPLTYGSLAGIVIGGIAIVLILGGCGVVIHGKRARKNYLRRREEQMKNWPSPQAGNGEMFETPVSQRPLRGNGWSDSPISGTTDGAYPPYPQYFSPYQSQYNSPVTGVEGPSQATWPVEKAHTIGMALSPDRDGSEFNQWSDVKGKDNVDVSPVGTDDGYEMQEGSQRAGHHGYQYPPPPPLPSQAPMLSHPGYGRQGQRTPSPPSDNGGHAI